jgi:hypothetical protein
LAVREATISRLIARCTDPRPLAGVGGRLRGKTMAKTYRDVAIDQMIATVEEAMSWRY